MPGRRRDSRFALSVPWEATLRVPGDVIVDRYDEDEVWVVSSSPAHRDELLTLELTGSGPPVTTKVRVVDSVPVLRDGIVRHRLQLAIVR
jgi:hypothetical protein